MVQLVRSQSASSSSCATVADEARLESWCMLIAVISSRADRDRDHGRSADLATVICAPLKMKTCLALERSFGALRQPQDDTLLTTRCPSSAQLAQNIGPFSV